MITQTKTFLILLIILLIYACNKNKIAGPEKIPSKEDIEILDNTISAIMSDLDIGSYSYALLTNKEVLSLKVKGVPADQKFPAGEMSDLFIGTLVLQCAENDELDIKDRLSQYGIEGEASKASFKNILSYTFNSGSQVLNYNPDNYPTAARALETATDKEIAKLFKSGIKNKLKMKQSSIQLENNSIQCNSSLNDLILFSMAVDNQQLFDDESTHNMMFRPIYLESGERSLAGLGCYIEIANDQKIIWAEGLNEEYSSLLLKSTADSVSLLIVANSPNMNAPFNLESGKIWNTPIYHTFRRMLSAKDSARIELNLYGDNSSIYESIQKMIDAGQRDVVYDELISYIRMYSWSKDKERLESLTELYKKFFPNDIPLEKLIQEPVAEIDRVMDYMQLDRTFSIEMDKVLTLYTTAEYTRIINMNPWEYDNLEVFFDLKHERTTSFNSSDDDRHLRFNYDHPGVTGNAPTFDGINWAQYDPDPNRFNFEIALPWRTLFNNDSLKPSLNQPIGFDIAIADNDTEVREGSLAWRAKLGEQPWANTSNYGSMILTDKAGAQSDTICYSIYTNDTVIIDGKNTGEWNNIPRYTTESVLFEGIQGPEDQAGWFRIRWDEENLYILVEFYDDVKRLLDPSEDYGWIANAVGDTIWKMTKDMGVPAGGDRSYEFLTTEIPLKAGDYQLHFQSNQTNSYGRWTNQRPELSFYGIILYD
jgi:hypothetical protein